MAHSWIEVFIDPATVASAADSDQPRKLAIAMLLDGRLDEFERRAPGVGLPSLSEVTASPALDAESRFVLAISLLTAGQAEALNQLISLAASPAVESDLRTVATVLAGIAMSDAGRPDLALLLLDERARAAENHVETAMLDLHWAVRAAECGRFADAVTRSTSARDASEGGGEPMKTIHIVAAHNAVHFDWLAGRLSRPEMPRRSESRPIAWIDILTADALEDYLDGHFTAFFEQPYSRSVTFAREDQTERGLSRGLFRAECIGDWQGLARARTSLGRYRLLSEAGRTSRGAAYGFELLRRARDAKGLERALSVFLAAGPLEPLRDGGAHVSEMPWWPLELRANLAIVAQSAVALDSDSAQRALDRILQNLSELLQHQPGSGWVVDPVMNALAALAPVVDASRQRSLSRAIRQLASEPPDPMIHQSIGRVLHSLDWTVLGDKERRLWLQYVEENLGSRDDHVFPAMAAAHELIPLRPRLVNRAALAAFRNTQSLYLVSLIVRRSRIPATDREAVEAGILGLARSMRQQVAEGRYSLGVISVGGLLGLLAVAGRRREVFDEAVAFASDPNVPLEERIAVARSFMRDPTKIPGRYWEHLASGLPAADVGFPLFGTPAELKGINLQLAATFGDVTPGWAMGQLLELAHAPSQEGRLQAVRSLRAIQGRMDPSALVAVVIGLTHDPDPFVRAAAGNALANTRVPEASEETRRARLVALLEEPGELVPRAVWRGLTEQRRLGAFIGINFDSRAQRVASGHIAYSVRKAAAEFLEAG